MKTRKELMHRLNRLLNTDYNFSRINLLDLERLVTATKKLIDKFARVGLKPIKVDFRKVTSQKNFHRIHRKRRN